jgi:hypothetical protein
MSRPLDDSDIDDLIHNDNAEIMILMLVMKELDDKKKK